MGDKTVACTYFSEPGEGNTQRVLEIAKARAEQLGIRSVVVATTTGYTGALAAQVFEGYNLVAVTHSTGFKEANYQELTEENRAAIQAKGGKVLTAQHGFGGVGRAVRKKLGTYELEELVAYTLRTFGEGMKVVCEIALMAADAGLIPSGQAVISIAGTGRGADTAVVLRAVNAQAFFDMRIMEVLCKPGFYGADQ
jgi:hypothetical protein